jgi:hypothetical protein
MGVAVAAGSADAFTMKRQPTVEDIDALIASLMALRRKVAERERKATRRRKSISTSTHI